MGHARWQIRDFWHPACPIRHAAANHRPGRGGGLMLSLAEARAKILERAVPGEPIEVPLTEAIGLVLAETATADVDSPPFERAELSGYAVRADDAPAGAR